MEPLKKKEKKPIRVKIVQKDKTKSIVETKQKKTPPPVDAKHHGSTDHKAKKEQVSRKKPVPTIGEAAQKTTPGTSDGKTSQPTTQSKKILTKKTKKPSLFSRSLALAKQQNLKTYQETVDENLPEGEILDLSTNDFRYMSYFIGLRKEISMVWVYPMSAARAGKQGKALVLFTIEKNGSVSYIKILESSGYKILDDAVIDTLKEISPFAPLPESFGKSKMNVKGYFNYIL